VPEKPKQVRKQKVPDQPYFPVNPIHLPVPAEPIKDMEKPKRKRVPKTPTE